jgi:hypothetical protein
LKHSAVIDGPNFDVRQFPLVVATSSPGEVEILENNNNNNNNTRDILLCDRLRQRCCAHRSIGHNECMRNILKESEEGEEMG